VFSDIQAKEKLESILHGLIFAEVLNQLNYIKNKLVIIVVPLLFRAPKYLELINYSVFVDCEYGVLFERVKQRSGLGEDIIKNIIASQVPRDMQMSLVSDIIENNGSLEELTLKVKQLYNKYYTARN
ncbi:MAG: dephospho-CoA kinase, partial [Burkholderiales bacterium]|nr:dephospho-CoA kinase [Burkholderiales bacterium]